MALIRPEPARGIGWRIRYKDPDTGKTVKVTMPPEVKNQEQREAHALAKSQELQKRKAALASGAIRATGPTLKATLERYFDDHPQLRPRTTAIYRTATDKLIAWAETTGLRAADDITASPVDFADNM